MERDWDNKEENNKGLGKRVGDGKGVKKRRIKSCSSISVITTHLINNAKKRHWRCAQHHLN